MILSDTDQYIKDNLENIISGKWNEHFDSYRIDELLNLSFILNNLDVGVGFFQFEYGSTKIKVSGIDDIMQNQFSFETIISVIKEDKEFKSALLQFRRDRKIEKIIN